MSLSGLYWDQYHSSVIQTVGSSALSASSNPDLFRFLMRIGRLEIALTGNPLWIETSEAFLLFAQVAGEAGIKDRGSASGSCWTCGFLVSMEGKQVN